jgi:signal transduction histidine kinase
VLVTLGDISERREAEQRLLEYAQELEMANGERRELDQLKSDFVAMASHELRTPLTSIAGFVKILLASRDARDDEAHRKYLEANARNYGRPPITVRITRTEAKVKISVTDSGDGIPRRLRPPPL